MAPTKGFCMKCGRPLVDHGIWGWNEYGQSQLIPCPIGIVPTEYESLELSGL